MVIATGCVVLSSDDRWWCCLQYRKTPKRLEGVGSTFPVLYIANSPRTPKSLILSDSLGCCSPEARVLLVFRLIIKM
jgi:hypothetical protein